MECWSYLPCLYCGCRFISNACSRLYFSHYFWILCRRSLPSKHIIKFLRLTVEELQALQAKGLIFLIIFGFFVENHLLVNTKSSFYLQFESYNICRQQALFFSLFSNSLLKITYTQTKNLVSMTYGLRVIIIAGNRPYFSHYFLFLC